MDGLAHRAILKADDGQSDLKVRTLEQQNRSLS
jgi:hypothetical protein